MNLLTLNTSVFNQLVEIVLPQMNHYQDDLLVHDKAILQVYKGSFLYGYRTTGTDLLCLLPEFKSYKENFKDKTLSDADIMKYLQEDIIWITGLKGERNKQFMFYDGNVLKPVTSDEADAILSNHLQTIFQQYEIVKNESEFIFNKHMQIAIEKNKEFETELELF